MTRDTLWYGGSTTKAILDATLARIIHNQTYPIVSRGWKTRIADIIGDDFRLVDDWATRHITLEDAASHRSGLPRHDLSWITANDSRSVRDVVRSLRFLPPSAEPRETFQYCNLMYVVLTGVLESITGFDWWSAVTKVLLEPLGMESSYSDLELAENSGKPVAKGYYWDGSSESYAPSPRRNFKAAFGAGAVISTVDDYLRWVRYAMDSGPVQDELRSVRTPMASTVIGAIPVRYSLGWMHSIIGGKKVWHHSGATTSHTADVYWVPDLQWGFVSFCNSYDGNVAMESIALRLLEEKLGTPKEDRHEPPAVPEEEDIDFIKEYYPDLTKTRLPSPVGTDQLVGTYHDDGYGTLKVQRDGDTLVGIPVGMEHDFAFEHVSGEFWLGFIRLRAVGATKPSAAAGVQFTTAVDGRANAMKLTLTPPGSKTLGEGPVTFKRIG